MTKRRLIRTLFALPIVLCLAGWLWSSTHQTWAAYGYGGRVVHLATQAGTLWFEWDVGFASPGWESFNGPLHPPKFWPSKEAGDRPWFLGFSYTDDDLPPDGYQCVFTVPYWFPLVVGGGVFAWVWRKTRRRLAPSAFPVELTALGGGGGAAGGGTAMSPDRETKQWKRRL